jgi:iron complex outermembrane receptor protein
MNLHEISICLYCFLTAFTSLAQPHADSIKQLPVVEISSPRSTTFSSGNKSEILDSTALSRYSTGNLADLLSNESQVFIKSYGLGSLATLAS